MVPEFGLFAIADGYDSRGIEEEAVLLAFCTAYSVYFSKACNYVESCKLPKRFSHASILQDLHGRVDGSDWQIVSQLRQFMSTSFDELDSLQSSTRISCSCNLEKDLYSLCHFAVASLLGVCGNAEAEKIQNGEDCLSALQGGLQVLSSILQKYLELPFVVPKYFFRVRSVFCFTMLDELYTRCHFLY